LKRLLHFAEDSDTSGYFPQLARWHDRNRYRMYFGTLKPMAPWLREYMESQGVVTFSCECPRRIKYPIGLVRLARFLRRERIDILHTHLFDPSVVGLMAGYLARTPTRVLTRHYSDYHTRINKKWHVRLDQLCTRLSHSVIAVSEHTREHMIAQEKAPPKKVRTILNGIDFDRVKLSEPAVRERLRREFDGDRFYLLLMVGRLHPEKGYPHLFRAISELKSKTDRPVRLLIAGTGPMADSFRDEVRQLGCDDAVQFLGFRKDVPDLMAAVDLVVHPAVAEAFGLSLTEALYIGTPVVASRVGGIPEIITDGIDGVLVPPAEPRALAETIVKMLHDPERRQAMAGAGREKVQRRFRFDEMVRGYEEEYSTVPFAENRNADDMVRAA
jgi:glycosyltransferase involved in cell wall biosynthesis